ncbi:MULTISPECIES: Rpn family recombination-promoting nuclease/putative transposase [unclassified Bacillus (in: firmicutes)]|uniref:Rpn family recombination-promoting nuclease/putative transposase n=1 Tax=unclassified Bacillus (in: firmicutes) TaxID=185979 RepID=UPI000BF5F55A|nr:MULTISPECIES: Rpn family recombination-promoting nuclease/putative transposase [unclassified Bacillus (in: firmicutes)]PEU18740.1 ATPase [Bacillus sp. AFS014408]PFW61304.1 ATPase [Bacillus sp. AFS075034]
MRCVSLQVDVAFRKIFGVEENVELLKGFLNAVLQTSLGQSIIRVEVKQLGEMYRISKEPTITLNALLENSEKINIEIYFPLDEYIKECSLDFWISKFRPQSYDGADIATEKTICINLIGCMMNPGKEEFHTKGQFQDGNLGVHFFELAKLEREWKKGRLNPATDVFVRWLLLLLIGRDNKLIQILDEIATKEDPLLERVIRKWMYLNHDDSFWRYYEARLKAIRDWHSELETAREKGIKGGVWEWKKQVIRNLASMGFPLEKIGVTMKLGIEDLKEILEEG